MYSKFYAFIGDHNLKYAQVPIRKCKRSRENVVVKGCSEDID